VRLTPAVFRPLIFSVSGFILSCAEIMSILTILYDFCLLPVQFYYMTVYIQKVESRVQIADRRATWKMSKDAENIDF
jgi:hypothetical protein